MFSYILLGIALFGTLTSTVFLGLALVAAERHKKKMAEQRARASKPTPPVSVIKPVHGMEPMLHESLESFFTQDYPDYELLFCARTRDDAALKIVDELVAKYPHRRVKILTCGEPQWTNAKLWSVQKMTEAASHDILVISDSDVRVTPDYVREVCHPLHDQKIGVVTCLYRGLPTGGLWSKLEALGMSVEMTSGVLIANMLEPEMKFALGPTMATRKDVLEKIGGWARMADYCSDDYLLGNWAADAGYTNVISEHSIDHIILNRNFASSLTHQVRWMKSTRCSRPKGHFGTVLTFAMPFGILGVIAGIIAGRPWLGAAIFGWAIFNRVMQSLAIGWHIVWDKRAISNCWLYPLRDLMGFFFWCASYGSNVIEWRGEKYRLEEEGKLVRVGD